jgi:hypothetical protein
MPEVRSNRGAESTPAAPNEEGRVAAICHPDPDSEPLVHRPWPLVAARSSIAPLADMEPLFPDQPKPYSVVIGATLLALAFFAGFVVGSFLVAVLSGGMRV